MRRLLLPLRLLQAIILAAGVFAVGAVEAAPTAAVTDEDAIALLSQSLGGWDIAGVAWAGMNPSERQSIRDQAAEIASMAEAARRDGIEGDPRVASVLKWGTNVLLAEEWEKKIVASTDLSEDAVRVFYSLNISRYRQPAAVRYRKAVWPPHQKAAAVRARKQISKTPLSRLKNSTLVEWTAFDDLPPELAKALREAPLRKTVGPIRTPEGFLLCEVLDRRKEGPIPPEECRDRVKEDMIRTAIKNSLP